MMKDEEDNVLGNTSHPAAAPSPPPNPTARHLLGRRQLPSIGFPHLYYPFANQSVPGYAVAKGRTGTVRERRLPCCGIGCGWFLLITGFFLIAIPYYVGLLILMCGRSSVDYGEKPGLIARTIAVSC